MPCCYMAAMAVNGLKMEACRHYKWLHSVLLNVAVGLIWYANSHPFLILPMLY